MRSPSRFVAAAIGRSAGGDMTSALNLSATEVAFPTNLPNTATLVTQANSEESLPAPKVPTAGALPTQESGDRTVSANLGYVRRHDYAVFAIYRLCVAAFVLTLIALGIREATF